MDFHNRSVLIFMAFFVVVGSLLIQGSTLPWLVRRLRLAPPDPGELALEEAALLDRATQAGDARLDEVSGQAAADVLARLRVRAEDRRNAAWGTGRPPGRSETPIEAYTRLRLAMLSAERGRCCRPVTKAVTDEAVRRVIRMMDVEQGMLDSPMDTGHGGTSELTAPTRSPGPAPSRRCAGLLDPGRSGLRRVPGRRQHMGAPTQVPVLRLHRLLRLVGTKTRRRTLHPHRPLVIRSAEPGRSLAVVLRRPSWAAPATPGRGVSSSPAQRPLEGDGSPG